MQLRSGKRRHADTEVGRRSRDDAAVDAVLVVLEAVERADTAPSLPLAAQAAHGDPVGDVDTGLRGHDRVNQLNVKSPTMFHPYRRVTWTSAWAIGGDGGELIIER